LQSFTDLSKDGASEYFVDLAFHGGTSCSGEKPQSNTNLLSLPRDYRPALHNAGDGLA
jgi:hypothetical protein